MDTTTRTSDSLPLMLTYVVIMAFSGMFFLFTVLSWTNAGILQQIMFTLVLVLTLYRWTGAVVLFWIQASLFFVEPATPGAVSGMGIVILSAAMVILLLCINRFRAIAAIHHHAVHALLEFLSVSRSAPNSGESGQSLSSLPRQILPGMVRVFLSVGAAALLLAMIPEKPDAPAVAALQPWGLRAIQVGLVITCLAVAIATPVGILMWRRISAPQAATYLRSVALQGIHRDLRMVVRRRLKLRRRIQKRTKKKS